MAADVVAAVEMVAMEVAAVMAEAAAAAVHLRCVAYIFRRSYFSLDDDMNLRRADPRSRTRTH